MRGSIIKRSENSYTIVLNLGKDPATGKRKQHWESVKRNKKDAEKRLGELLHQLDTGTFVKPDRMTLAEYLDLWLQDYCRANLAPTTAQTYAFFVHRHIAPAIGNIPVSQLKPSDLQHLYGEKKSHGLGNRSVRYLHQTLHRALKSAVKLGMIARNPADSVDVPKVKSREMQTMTESDVHLLLDFARSTEYYPLIYLAIFSGLRRSELLALEWQDIDLIRCQLSVSRTLHQLHSREIIIRQPKTEKGRRMVSLTPSSVAVLTEHRLAQETLRQKLGLPAIKSDDFVFCHYDGSPLLPDSVSQAWRNLAHRTGLKGIRLHDCRHTHASLLLKQNVHPAVVAQRLGHSSVQITLDTYSHLLPGLQEAAAARFDDILLPKP